MITAWFAAGAMLAAGPQINVVTVDEQFSPPQSYVPPAAVTYDLDAVPAASKVTVVEYAGDVGTAMVLRVRGLKADRTYGAHVHTKPCGAQPNDAGGHYQNAVDPKPQPSGDQAFANPDNEVWLDLTTDGSGNGQAVAFVPWRFRTGEAQSVVMHEHGTPSEAGKAGNAGTRVACVSVPLK